MTWKPDIFIYHSPCDDGFAAAWAVHQRWGDSVEYLPCSYGGAAPDVAGKNVLIGDFSFKYDLLTKMSFAARSIVILDHHKTAQEDLGRLPAMRFPFVDEPRATFQETCWTNNMPEIAAYFDMNKSGARLTWEFCHPDQPIPALIAYVEDRDLYRFALEGTRALSLYLRSHPYDFETWSRIALELEAEAIAIHAQAAAIELFYDQKIAELVGIARNEAINGWLVPVVNCPWAFASDVAHALLAAYPDAPFAACYYDRGDGTRSYSLRSEDSRADVSAIAKRYGGGGHRNAAGFEVPLV